MITPEERKVKIAEMRAYHASKVVLPSTVYFTAKCPHTPEGKDYKHIGLYESEAGKGDDVYLELVTMDYHPLDSSRTLYMWKHNSDYKRDYDVKKDQFMIPVSELKVVSKEEKISSSSAATSKAYPKVNGIYEHYKGGHYEVLMLAKHSETQEDMVVYRSIHFGSFAVRPLTVWFKRPADNIERFKLIK